MLFRNPLADRFGKKNNLMFEKSQKIIDFTGFCSGLQTVNVPEILKPDGLPPETPYVLSPSDGHAMPASQGLPYGVRGFRTV
jgi:hypothetical protein